MLRDVRVGAVRATVFVLALLIAALGSGQSIPAQAPVTPKLPTESHRIIVKLAPSLAGQVEAELATQGPLSGMEISAGQARGAAVQSFLAKYSPIRMTPLYPAMIRARQQHGWSDAQIAGLARQQFPHRAARQTDLVAVPEISRTYVLEFAAANASQINGLMQRLQVDPNVEFSERDQYVSTVTLPNDPFLSSSGTWGQPFQDLWGHYKVNAPAAWNTAQGDGITVAVVDTGIDYNHPDIAANVIVLAGSDFIGSSCNSPTTGNDPIDHFGHGTHVAGTIAAVGNNGIGIIGIAWHAKVLAVKGLDDNGCGLESTLAPAIQFAANNGADVINASWGGQGTSQTIEQAIQFATAQGVIFVAAAGNSAADASFFFPANSPEAITVAASDAFNTFAFFSNFGTKIDVTGPGVDVLSLQANGTALGLPASPSIPGYIRLSGTSMATPHVAATTALVLSQHPAYTTEQIRAVLRASGTSATGADWDPNFGYGIVNAQGALALPDALSAHITSPATGIFVNSPITISGTALGTGFDHYILEYGSGPIPTVWTQFASGTSPVSANTLGTLDPSTLADGLYTIRLSAIDSANNAFRDRVQITVRYLFLTDPSPALVPGTATEFKPGTQVAINGTATAPAFQSFNVQWAEGTAPTTGWSSTGITLVGGGSTQVSAGPLATWDTTGIATTPDYYTLRLQVVDGSMIRQTQTMVYLEPSLLSVNWPHALSLAPDFASGMVPATDGSGNTSLALVGALLGGDPASAQYMSFSADGSSQFTSPLVNGSYFNPAAGNIDGIAGDEVVVADLHQLLVFHSDGSSTTLQAPASPEPFFYTFDQIVLQDVLGSGQLDVVELGNTFFTDLNAGLAVWQPNGSQLNGNFPLTIPDQNFQTLLGPIFPRVMVGDIKGDGHREFVVAEGISQSTYTLGLFAQDGTPLTWAVPTLSGEPLAIGLADLDHNGALETLLTEIAGFPNGPFNTVLHVFQPDGTERTGFPVVVGNPNFSYILVGDLNRDGTEEIVTLIDNVGVFAYEPDGTPFPLGNQVGSNVKGPVALADVDGDGLPEILFTIYKIDNFSSLSAVGSPALGSTSTGTGAVARTEATHEGNVLKLTTTADVPITPQSSLPFFNASLVAMKPDGSIARKYQIQGAQGNEPGLKTVITVGDFNHDGITDLALSYLTVLGGGVSGAEGTGVATVLSTGGQFNADANDWPMILQNPQNTATLRRSITMVLSPGNGSQVNGTVNIAAATTGNIASLQFKIDGSNFGSVLTGAPFTVPWDTTQFSSGIHKLSALAIDAITGRPVAAGAVSVNIVRANNSNLDLALTAGSNPAPVGTSLTYTANVRPSTATGNVNFFDGATAISGNIPLSNGSASFTTKSLAGGTHNITARYGGDANFNGSTSPAVAQNITDFSLTSNTSSASIHDGGSANFTFTVTPLGGFNQTVSFSCSGLPAEAQCTFNPASLTPNGAPVTSTLTITTTAPSAALGRAPFEKNNLPLYATLSSGLLGMVWLAAGGRRRRKSAVLLACFTLCTIALLASCGGGNGPSHHDPGTPLGTSQVTVTTTAGSTNHSAQVTVTVTQ